MSMSDDEKNAALVQAMAVVEGLRGALEISERLQKLTFEEVTPEVWAGAVLSQELLQMLIKGTIQGVGLLGDMVDETLTVEKIQNHAKNFEL